MTAPALLPNNLAQVLSRQGKYEEAEGIHRQTLALKESVLGKKHPNTLGSMNNLEAERKAARTTSFCVWDMPICPASHDYEGIGETNGSCLPRVPSIVRASEKQEKCDICSEKGYVSPLQLLLLTRTDLTLTALVLSPISSQSMKEKGRSVQEVDEVYQRLGLFEIGRPGEDPWIETADGFQIPAEALWEMDRPSARRTITIV